MKKIKVTPLVLLAVVLILGGLSIWKTSLVGGSLKKGIPPMPAELKEYLVEVTTGTTTYTVNSRREFFVNKNIVTKLPLSQAVKVIENIKSLANKCTVLGTSVNETYTYIIDGKTTNFAQDGSGCKEAQESVMFLKGLVK